MNQDHLTNNSLLHFTKFIFSCFANYSFSFFLNYSFACFAKYSFLCRKILFLPCIMCVHCRGGGGGGREVFSTMMHVGGYLEYHRGCSVPWGDIIFCNLSTVGNIMMHVGDIMSTVGGVQYRGGF